MTLKKTRETKYFHVCYEEADDNIIEQIVTLVDTTYETVIKRFKLKADTDKFHFLLCPDRESFKKLTGKSDDEYEDWMVGNADYESRRLCILSPNVVCDRSFENMLSVVKHEIVHIAFDQLQNAEEANILIAEGIAVACAEQIDCTALNEKNYPAAKKLMDEQYFYENEGYLYSGVYVLHLLNQVGTDSFKSIYAGREAVENYFYDGFERDAIQVATYAS